MDMDHHSSQYKVKETRFWGAGKPLFPDWERRRQDGLARGIFCCSIVVTLLENAQLAMPGLPEERTVAALLGLGRCLDLASHPFSLSSPCDPMSGFLP